MRATRFADKTPAGRRPTIRPVLHRRNIVLARAATTKWWPNDGRLLQRSRHGSGRRGWSTHICHVRHPPTFRVPPGTCWWLVLSLLFVCGLCRWVRPGPWRDAVGGKWIASRSGKGSTTPENPAVGARGLGEGTGMGELCTKCRFNERLAVMCVCVCVRRRLPRGWTPSARRLFRSCHRR